MFKANLNKTNYSNYYITHHMFIYIAKFTFTIILYFILNNKRRFQFITTIHIGILKPGYDRKSIIGITPLTLYLLP